MDINKLIENLLHNIHTCNIRTDEKWWVSSIVLVININLSSKAAFNFFYSSSSMIYMNNRSQKNDKKKQTKYGRNCFIISYQYGMKTWLIHLWTKLKTNLNDNLVMRGWLFNDKLHMHAAVYLRWAIWRFYTSSIWNRTYKSGKNDGHCFLKIKKPNHIPTLKIHIQHNPKINYHQFSVPKLIITNFFLQKIDPQTKHDPKKF